MTEMAAGRVEADVRVDELSTLIGFLDYQRATLMVKCADLTPEQLARPASPPSIMSLLGLVRHLADVERGWFQRRLAAEVAPPMYWNETDPDGDFEFGPADAARLAELTAEGFATWRAQVAKSDAILAGVSSLEQTFVHDRDRSVISVRWLLVHMIEEYARHNGHADLLREAIDGATGE
jgi:uncharacterized damage-inducible protein DinB